MLCGVWGVVGSAFGTVTCRPLKAIHSLCCWYRHRERDRQTETDRDRETDRQRDRETDIATE